MKTILHRARQYVLLAASLSLALTVALPALEQTAFAAGQITSRSITLSDSTPSAGSVSYKLTFTPVTTAQELIVDFCSDSPIIGASCAFAAATVPNVASVTGGAGVVSAIGTGTPKHTIKVTGLTMTAATPFTITFSAISNPTSVAYPVTFYARVLTYGTGNATNYAPANTTGNTPATGAGNTDNGGIALSTAQQISITATVQEQLVFCVSGSTISPTCTGLSTPTLIIGSGSPAVLTTTGNATPAYTQLSTNASSGVTVAMKAVNACTNGGLSTAPPDSSGGCTNLVGVGSSAAVLTSGKFGMCVSPGAGVGVPANYTDSINACPTSFNATSKYGMNGTNLTSTYGDTIYTTAGAVNSIQSSLTFAAMAANTTPAGIYQGNEILIATGVF